MLKEAVQKKIKWYLGNDNDDRNDDKNIFPDIYLNGNKLGNTEQNTIILQLNRYVADNHVRYRAIFNIAVFNYLEEQTDNYLECISVKFPDKFIVNDGTAKKIPGNLQFVDVRFDYPMYPQEWKSEGITIEFDLKDM